MSVYVDTMQAQYRRMIMCHMIADSSQELLAMADRIGVARKWLQNPGTANEHFDIAQTKRALALEYGAIEITWRQCGAMTMLRRMGIPMGPPDTAVDRCRQQMASRSKGCLTAGDAR